MFSNLCLIYFMGIVVLKEFMGLLRDIGIIVYKSFNKLRKSASMKRN